MNRRSLGSILVLLIAGTFLFLYDPANSTFYTDDEWLYIGTASEMFDRGELWITYWLGEPAYYKPPLSYWMMMPFFLLGEDRILQGRIAIGVTTILTLLSTYWIGRTLYGEKQGLAAALISAASLGFLTYGRVGMLDMPFTLMLTLALACLVKAWREKADVWAGLFWAVAGASVLVKGPVSAVILFAVCFLTAFFFGGWRSLFFSRGAITGMAAAVAFTLSWPAALYFKGQFDNWFQFFVIGENLGKFGDPSVYPAGRFLAYVLQWQAPWTLLLLVALCYLPLHRRIATLPIGLPLVWGLTVMLVYLIPRVRLPWYLLPVIPPASLLIAAMLKDYGEKLPFKLAFRATGLLLLVPAVVLGVLVWNAPFTLAQRLFFLTASLSLVVSAGCAWRIRTLPMLLAFALCVVTLAQGVSSLTDGRLPQNVAAELRNSSTPVAAARIETGRLSQQLWFFSYQLHRKVTESRTAPEIARFLTEKGGRVFISETDLGALKKDLPDRAAAIQVYYSWNYWKENISTEDIRAALLQGELGRLMEKVHVVGM